jgi:hypothetical protein
MSVEATEIGTLAAHMAGQERSNTTEMTRLRGLSLEERG